jgi:hypothetical protein
VVDDVDVGIRLVGSCSVHDWSRHDENVHDLRHWMYSATLPAALSILNMRT